MGNLLDFCISRSEYVEKQKKFVLCRVCDKHYIPDMVLPPICHDCKLLENDGYYEFEATSSLLSYKDYHPCGPEEPSVDSPKRCFIL